MRGNISIILISEFQVCKGLIQKINKTVWVENCKQTSDKLITAVTDRISLCRGVIINV